MTTNQQVSVCILTAVFVFATLHSLAFMRQSNSVGVSLWAFTAALAASVIVAVVA